MLRLESRTFLEAMLPKNSTCLGSSISSLYFELLKLSDHVFSELSITPSTSLSSNLIKLSHGNCIISIFYHRLSVLHSPILFYLDLTMPQRPCQRDRLHSIDGPWGDDALTPQPQTSFEPNGHRKSQPPRDKTQMMLQSMLKSGQVEESLQSAVQRHIKDFDQLQGKLQMGETRPRAP